MSLLAGILVSPCIRAKSIGDSALQERSACDQLIDFVAECDSSRVPSSAFLAAKRVVLDATGVMLGASGLAPEARPFVELARAGGPGPAGILGTSFKVSTPYAAFAGGAFAHALDFEDVFDLSPGHPNASLMPVLLALAQAEGPIDGRRFLTTLIVGCEVSCRMGLALRQRMEVGGWYPPPILAGFGAVAGAANLLGLGASEVRNAFSLMLCQATMPGEIKFSVGSQVRAVREAFPALAAVNSAFLARAGVSGFERPLDGKAGFYALYADSKFEAADLHDGLGERFWIEQLTFKPWPSCRGTHAFIEMALDLRQEHGLEPGSISQVTAEIDGDHLMLVEPEEARRRPQSAIEAKFSIPFTLGLALAKGKVALDDFGEGDLGDSTILSLAQKVRVNLRDEPQWRKGSGGGLTIELSSGERFQTQRSRAIGSPDSPISDTSLLEKFIDCAGKAEIPLQRERATELGEAILALENSPDVAALFRDAGALG